MYLKNNNMVIGCVLFVVPLLYTFSTLLIVVGKGAPVDAAGFSIASSRLGESKQYDGGLVRWNHYYLTLALLPFPSTYEVQSRRERAEEKEKAHQLVPWMREDQVFKFQEMS